jgi:hypothetical protein
VIAPPARANSRRSACAETGSGGLDSRPGTYLDIAVAEGMLVITRASFAGGPDSELVRKALDNLQREYRRRFRYPRHEEQ